MPKKSSRSPRPDLSAGTRSPVRLRKVRPEDLHAVQELVRRTIEVCYPAFYSPKVVEHFQQHQTAEQIAADAAAGYTVVVEHEGRIVGTGTLLENKVRRIFVAPDCQRSGVGARIVRALERRARTQGLPALELGSTLGARAFYESLGYAVAEDIQHDLGDGEILRCYRMRKKLGSKAAPPSAPADPC